MVEVSIPPTSNEDKRKAFKRWLRAVLDDPSIENQAVLPLVQVWTSRMDSETADQCLDLATLMLMLRALEDFNELTELAEQRIAEDSH